MEYVIKKGDNLSSLAKQFNTTIAALVKANKIKDPDKIYAGDKLSVPEQPKPKPQKEWRQGLLTGDPAMFNPQAQALEGSYPELMAIGVPGLLRATAAKGLLASPQVAANYRNIPAWLQNPATQGVIKQNPTRMFNDLSRQAVANETKFSIGGTEIPEAVMLERMLMARRFQ